jgi:hypothetical protein
MCSTTSTFRHPGEVTSCTRTRLLSQRVPAERVMHLFERLRPGQIQGVPWFAPAIVKLRDLDESDDAELVRKKIEACFAAFVTGDEEAATLAPMAGWMAGGGSGEAGGGIGMMLAGLFHQGGVVGRDGAPSRTVDASLFLAAPRYHTGGLAGLAPDELPAILRRGEAVLTPQQVAALGLGTREREARQPPVTVVMNITTPDTNGFRQSQGQIAADAARAIERARRNL